MMNSKMIKGYLVAMLVFISAINFTQINSGQVGANCQSQSNCDSGLQCYNGVCTKRCSGESDCAGLPGRHVGCSQGYCQLQ